MIVETPHEFSAVAGVCVRKKRIIRLSIVPPVSDGSSARLPRLGCQVYEEHALHAIGRVLLLLYKNRFLTKCADIPSQTFI